MRCWPGSPAIDAGNNALAVDPDGLLLTVDQRGLTRVIDGDNNGTATVDIGAFEFGSAILLGDVNRSGAVDFLDISPFIAVLSSSGFQAEADVNLDGTVDFLDISPFIALLSAPTSNANSAQLTTEPAEAAPQVSDGFSVEFVAAAAEPLPQISVVTSAQVSAEPSEPSRQISDGFSVKVVAAPLKQSLPTDVARTQLSAEPSLLAFVGGGQLQSWDVSHRFRNEIPVWNSEPIAMQLSHRKADRLAVQESSHDSGSRASSIFDASTEPAIASSSAHLFDTHPELLEGLTDSQLDKAFEELLI